MTSDEENTIRNLWAHGFSAEDIASQLEGWSRNRVIGAVHRLGLAKRDIDLGNKFIKRVSTDRHGEKRVTYWYNRRKVVFRQQPSAPPPGIISPPGYKLLQVLKAVFPKRFYKGVLEQTVFDMQEEYNECLAEGDLKLAKWVRVRGYLSVGLAIFTAIPASLLGKFSALSKSE